MPLIQGALEALPYIDVSVTEQQLIAANALVQAEIDPQHASSMHPSIPQQRPSNFSKLIENEHARATAGKPKEGGLDLSRYELLDPPAKGNLPAWKSTLAQAYTSAGYLQGREINLSLLEVYGKNAWLIGNSQLEDELKSLEKELEQAKLLHEEVEQTRRNIQANATGEMHGLEESWRSGVGRMIEAQAAAERLRLDILERKRRGAS